MENSLFICSIIFFALALPCIICTCFFDVKQKMLLKTIFKASASFCILIGCILIFCKDNYWNDPKILVLVGVVTALLGDVFLSEFAKGKTRDIFSGLGLLAFVCTHVLYIVAFLLSSFKISVFIVFAPISGIIIMAFLVLIKVLKPDNLVTTIGILIYSGVVFLMLGCAINLFAVGGIANGVYALVGATLFLGSDVLLSLVNFNKAIHNQRKYVFPAILVLYYLGQVFIVLSMVM